MTDRIIRRGALFACATLLFAATVSTTLAANRPDTRAMGCINARALVQDYREVVMTTGQYTYARIVSGYGQCEPGQYTELKLVPTQDDPACHVGYVCREKIVDKNR